MRFKKRRNVTIECNMENILFVAALIAGIHFILTFLEMRMMEEEPKPLKILIKNTLIVFASVSSGLFILEQLKPVMEEQISVPMVFTGDPAF
jgi:hypothetical protein